MTRGKLILYELMLDKDWCSQADKCQQPTSNHNFLQDMYHYLEHKWP
jgi:hypothetical protein